MDVTATAAALSQLAGVVGANGGQPVSPMTLSVLGGVVASHVIQPHTEGLSAKLKPIVALAGPAVVAAATAMSQGTPWQAAAGYGVITAVSAATSHWAFFKSNGFSAFLSGIVGALAKR